MRLILRRYGMLAGAVLCAGFWLFVAARYA